VGVRRSLRLLPAELAGYLLSIATLTLVLGPRIAAQPMLGRGLRLASGAWLAVVAVRLWRSGAQGRRVESVTIRHVLVTTLLNPKGLVFAFVIFPPMRLD